MRSAGVFTTLSLVAVMLAGCSSASPETTPTQSVTAEPSPTQTAAANEALAFGETATLDAAGSVWDVTINEPRDVTAEIAAGYEGTGLELDLEEGMTLMGVPGTVTRIGDGPGDPWEDLEVTAVIDNRTVEHDSQSLDEPGALVDVGELFPGGTADFVEVFRIPAGSTIPTVSVVAGMGEASQRVFFGEAVDLGAQEDVSASPDVESMKYVWEESTDEQQATSMTAWKVSTGEAVSDESVQLLIAEATPIGIILDDSEAREFLEWVVAQ